MTFDPADEITAIAALVHVRQDLLEIRYHTGCMFTAEGLTEVQEKRRSMMSDRSYGMLTIIPGDVDFNLGAMSMDHLAKDRSMGQVLATAVVAKGSLIEQIINIYFKYYPQMHHLLVTDKEDEARTWIIAELDKIAATGK